MFIHASFRLLLSDGKIWRDNSMKVSCLQNYTLFSCLSCDGNPNSCEDVPQKKLNETDQIWVLEITHSEHSLGYIRLLSDTDNHFYKDWSQYFNQNILQYFNQVGLWNYFSFLFETFEWWTTQLLCPDSYKLTFHCSPRLPPPRLPPPHPAP